LSEDHTPSEETQRELRFKSFLVDTTKALLEFSSSQVPPSESPLTISCPLLAHPSDSQ